MTVNPSRQFRGYQHYGQSAKVKVGLSWSRIKFELELGFSERLTIVRFKLNQIISWTAIR